MKRASLRRNWLRAPALLIALALAGCQGDSGNDVGPDPVPARPSDPPVTRPASELPRPIVGGTLGVLSDGRTAIASDPDRDRIFVVDLAHQTVIGTIVLLAGDEPWRHAEDGAGRVHVSLRGAGAIATVDPRAGTLLSRRSVCAAPRGIAYDAGRDLLHVACAGGELVSIAPTAQTPARTLALTPDLRDVAVAGERVLVTTFRQAELLEVGDHGIAQRLSPPRTQAAFRAFGRKMPPPGTPGDPGLGTASPAVAWRMTLGPDKQPVVVHQRGVDAELGTEPGGYTNPQGCAGIVEGAITEFYPETTALTGLPQVRSGRAMAGAVLPVDLAIAPSGKQLAVVAAGQAGSIRQLQFYAMSEVTAPAMDQAENPCVTPSPVPVPEVPPTGDASAPGATGGLPAPADYRPPNGEIVAVAFDPRGNVIVQRRDVAELQILTQRAVPIGLSSEHRVDMGHQLFHGATSGMVACASCHPEGGEDSRTWRFLGVGPRRTQSLRGGIMGTAPFHWGGELRHFQHLMTDVFQGRMAGPALMPGQVQALESWMDRIPRIQSSRASDDPAALRGQALFNSAEVGCASCHGGNHFTNNLNADVGTGGSFQVPQLHGLALRAPYLHNGCATTLEQRFTTCGGGDKHGVTSRLSRAQLSDLIAYLESL